MYIKFCPPLCAIAYVSTVSKHVLSIFLSSRPGGKELWFVRSLVLMAKERKKGKRGKKARKERKEKRRKID